MRVQEQTRDYFRGTHKGGLIEIERDDETGRLYITVRGQNGEGGYLYDGYAPTDCTLIRNAKREAIRGACL